MRQTLEPTRDCPGPTMSGGNTFVGVTPLKVYCVDLVVPKMQVRDNQTPTSSRIGDLFVHRVDSTGATQEAQGPKGAVGFGRPLTSVCKLLPHLGTCQV